MFTKTNTNNKNIEYFNETIGSLMFLIVIRKSNLVYIVTILSQFVKKIKQKLVEEI